MGQSAHIKVVNKNDGWGDWQIDEKEEIHDFSDEHPISEDEDEFYDNGGNERNNIIDDENDVEEENGPAMDALKAWRNDIADAMWAQYQLHLANL